MTEVEKAYVAGYVDADGSLGLQRVNRKKHGEPSKSIEYRPYICITASRKDIMEKINDMLPRKLSLWTGRNCKKGEYSKRYHTKLMGSDRKVYDICEAILPYLILKKRQAELLIEVGKMKSIHKNGKYYRDGKFNADAYEKIYEPMRDKIRRYNKENYSVVIA